MESSGWELLIGVVMGHGKRSESGFSITEVLIVVAILGILSTGIAATLSFFGNGMSSVNNKSNLITLGDDINEAIARLKRAPSKCPAVLSFGGPIVAGADVPLRVRLDAHQTVQASLATKDGLKVESLVFKAAELISSSATQKIFSGSVELNAQSTGQDILRAPRRLSKLVVRTDADGKFLTCDFQSDREQEYCEALGGKYDPDSDPRCTLPPVANQMCPDGQFVIGLENGQIVCSGGSTKTEEIFTLGATSCGGAYCACSDARSYEDFRWGTPDGHTPSQNLAMHYCKSKGYAQAKDFTVATGWRGQPQAGVNGENMFINQYWGNTTCATVTCTNDTSVTPVCPAPYKYTPTAAVWTPSGYVTTPGCDL